MAAVRQIEGYRETLNVLRKLDKELYKDARRDMRAAVQPSVQEMKALTPLKAPLSGMNRAWTDRQGHDIYPWDGAAARRGIKLRWRLSKNRFAFLIEQVNPGAQVFDDAGKAKNSPLARSLTSRFGESWRILYRVMNKNQSKIEGDLESAIEVAQIRLNARLRRS